MNVPPPATREAFMVGSHSMSLDRTGLTKRPADWLERIRIRSGLTAPLPRTDAGRSGAICRDQPSMQLGRSSGFYNYYITLGPRLFTGVLGCWDEQASGLSLPPLDQAPGPTSEFRCSSSEDLGSNMASLPTASSASTPWLPRSPIRGFIDHVCRSSVSRG